MYNEACANQGQPIAIEQKVIAVVRKPPGGNRPHDPDPGRPLWATARRRQLASAAQAGITHIVNCTDELPNYHEDQFVYLAMKMFDPDPCFTNTFPDVCRFIDDGRRQGKVLVHCFASISRSPAVVLTYLCHLGDPLRRAAERLAGIVWTSRRIALSSPNSPSTSG